MAAGLKTQTRCFATDTLEESDVPDTVYIPDNSAAAPSQGVLEQVSEILIISMKERRHVWAGNRGRHDQEVCGKIMAVIINWP